MRKYRASNRVPFASFVLLILVGAVAGAIVGGILWALDSILNFYLVLLFPLIGGAIVGGALSTVARIGRVRSPFITALVAILSALVMFGVYHGASYAITFRSEMRDAYVENAGSSASDEDFERALNKLMFSEVGDTGFVGYLKLVAREGFSITRTSSFSSTSDSGLELKDELVWGYWAIEILVAAGIAAWIAARAAGEPFDEEANAWYGKPTLLAIASNKSRKALLNALKDGDFLEAGSLMTTQDLKHPRLEITIRQSPAGGGTLMTDTFLTVNYAQRKGRSNAVRSGVVSPSELDLISRGMQQAALQNPAVSGR
ncbi:MAG: hypothetical protein IT319_07620 [Anaerolineae bacterium]|nr:hypothetical protein [Anaerolineae bacterium]